MHLCLPLFPFHLHISLGSQLLQLVQEFIFMAVLTVWRTGIFLHKQKFKNWSESWSKVCPFLLGIFYGVLKRTPYAYTTLVLPSVTWYQRLDSLTYVLEIWYGSSFKKKCWASMSFIKMGSVAVILKGIKHLCLHFPCFVADVGQIWYRKYQF